MTTLNLGAASWALAKARLRLEVAASASLDAHDLVLKDNEDLLSEDIWIQKGHNFHFSFLISFDSVSSNSDMLNGDTLPDFVASVLTQAPVRGVRSNMASANDDLPVLVAVTSRTVLFCTASFHR
jgi:hypothetical protein